MTDSRHTSLFQISQYEDDITGRESNLNENCLVSSGSQTHDLPNQLRPLTLKTSVSTKTNTTAYVLINYITHL